MVVYMTVFQDGVKLEIDHDSKRQAIGWFTDEVSAIAAAFERTLIRSAILPELRRMLPEVIIQCEYKDVAAGKAAQASQPFKRGTQVRYGSLGRRVVRNPGAMAKAWLR